MDLIGIKKGKDVEEMDIKGDGEQRKGWNSDGHEYMGRRAETKRKEEKRVGGIKVEFLNNEGDDEIEYYVQTPSDEEEKIKKRENGQMLVPYNAYEARLVEELKRINLKRQAEEEVIWERIRKKGRMEVMTVGVGKYLIHPWWVKAQTQ